MTIICQTCNKQANKKGMIVVEEPDWGNCFFFCSWKCLANFSLKKFQQEVKDAKTKTT